MIIQLIIMAVFVCGMAVVLSLLFGVLVTRSSLRQFAAYPIKECTFQEIPETVKKFFSDRASILSSIGFNHRGYYIHDRGMISSQVGFVELLINRDTQIAAKSYYLMSSHALVGYIEFISLLDNDTVILTANSPRSIMAVPASMRVIRKPVQDIVELYQLHVVSVRAAKQGASLKDISVFDYPRYTEQVNRRILVFQEEQGLMVSGPDGNTFRPTLTGALHIVFEVLKRHVLPFM